MSGSDFEQWLGSEAIEAAGTLDSAVTDALTAGELHHQLAEKKSASGGRRG